MIDDLYLEYGERDTESLTLADIKRLRAELPSVQLAELKNQNDFIIYIELVKKFRENGIMFGNAAQGAGFQAWLTNTLSVGEDGIYADGETRFLFELIQNVDDCEYDDIASANLDIQFKFAEAEIVLTYNEKGFRPIDIFNITGIAEQSKNISADKVEIGEKGIGFKSVFGIADRVLIQSGGFSFVLEKGNFTVPVPSYNGFSNQVGTRLTLFISGGEYKVKTIFSRLVERYKSESSLVNKNPILFLNKLTRLKIFFDGFRNIEFHIDRAKPLSLGQNLEFEESITIRSDFRVALSHDGTQVDKEFSRQVRCYKYQKDIVFSRAACVDRYGETTNFREKKMRLYLLFPHIDELEKIKQGSLYSFLPTQTVTAAPLIIHAPFKLAASRDYVDSQGGNKWFAETVTGIESLLTGSFKHLATQVKTAIARYLPRQRFVFDGNEKVDCLRIQQLSKARILEEQLFVCSDGEYRIAKEVCAFFTDDSIKDGVKAHRLANIQEGLFLAESTAGIDAFGIKVYKGIKDDIFIQALESESISREALEFLATEEYKPDGEKIKQKLKDIDFSIATLRALSCFDDYKKAVVYALVSSARNEIDTLPQIDISPSVAKGLSAENHKSIEDVLKDLDDKSRFKRFWAKISGKCYCIDDIAKDLFFPTKEFLLISTASPLGSIALFASRMDNSRDLYLSLQIRDVSERLNKLCDDKTIDGDEFFDALVKQRKLLKKVLDDGIYEKLIALIQDAGADKARFLKELIQNADDCDYQSGEKPKLTIELSKQRVTMMSNERGFTRKNLRAITAIGESTKKELRDKGKGPIGEKGIGFKSIFGIAESVTIRSRKNDERFDFSLSAATPTIPKKESDKGFEHLTGTRMDFHLKEPVPESVFDENKIIDICRCLRKLRHIEIGDILVGIKDNDDGTERIITIKKGHITTKTIKMRIVRHDFEVDDEQAIAERTDNHSIAINNQQTVIVYIPEKSTDNKGSTFPLYSGLPTNEMVNAPLYIDAPFELTASREHIHKNRWNEYIAGEVLVAVSKALVVIAKDERKGVLDYIPKDGELFTGKFAEGIDFESAARQFKFLPTLDEEYFAAAFSGLTYYPNFVRLLLEKTKIHEIDNKKTLDFFLTLSSNTERYSGILGYLQCKLADDSKILDIIENYAPKYMNDTNIRGAVYSYLKNIQQQTKQGFLHRIKQLKIIPVKSPEHDKPIFTSFGSKPTWYGDSEKSTGSYNILFVEWLPKDDYNKIFDAYIQEMNDGERRTAYEKKLEEIFKKADRKKEYEWLRSEFQNNRGELQRSQGWFLQNKYKIPLLTAVGSYCYASGSLFKADASVYDRIQGKHLKLFLVSKECLSLADFLGLSMIEKITFSEYSDYEEIKLTKEDILDLRNSEIIPYYQGIAVLEACIDAGYISDTIIAEMRLEGFRRKDITEGEYEFPTKPVRDNLDIYIKKMMESPTVIIDKKVEQNVRFCRPASGKEFKLSESSDDYPKGMYSPGGTARNICFCQWCKKPFDLRYIEINKIEFRTDEFYWDELKLSFCLEHSKDFKALRNNPVDRNRFIDAILNNEIEIENGENGNIVSVKIGKNPIAFTERHFAEIQQILLAMKQNEVAKH